MGNMSYCRSLRGTTPADAEAWSDAQPVRSGSKRWPADDICSAESAAVAAARMQRSYTAKPTLPHCTGLCNQGRALCPHPIDCDVLQPAPQLAPAEELQQAEYERTGATAANSAEREHRLFVGLIALLLLFMLGVSVLFGPQAAAFFKWAGGALARPLLTPHPGD